MIPDRHAAEAAEYAEWAFAALDRADNVEPSKLSRDIYAEAQVKATIALTHAVLSLRGAAAEVPAEPERVAYRDRDGDVWIGTDDALRCPPTDRHLTLEHVAADFGPLTQITIPEDLR